MKPELKIEYKDVSEHKITISKDRFDIKISNSRASGKYFNLDEVLNKAKDIFEKKWDPNMVTYRESISHMEIYEY